jgi:hypothetical protein
MFLIISRIVLTAAVMYYVVPRLIAANKAANEEHARRVAEHLATWKPEYGYCARCGTKKFPRQVPNGYDEVTGERATRTEYDCSGCFEPDY